MSLLGVCLLLFGVCLPLFGVFLCLVCASVWCVPLFAYLPPLQVTILILIFISREIISAV